MAGSFSPTLVATNNASASVLGFGPEIQINPSIRFTASPTNGTTPLTVQFTCPNVDSSGNPITNWNWAFGDGAISTLQNPLHTYSTGGSFPPILIATNNNNVAVFGFGPEIQVFAPTNAAPGSILWTIHQTYSVNGVGVSTSGTVFFMGDHGLTAVGTNGSVLWSTNIPSNPKGSLAVSTNGTVYSQSVGGLFAVNASGSIVWSLSNISGGDNGPAIGSDGTIYIGYEDTNFVQDFSAISPNGSMKWSMQIDDYAYYPVIGPDGTTYAVGGHHIAALTPNGTIKWTYFSATNLFDGLPAVGPDGVLYFSGDNFFYAFDASGQLKWQVEPGGSSYPVLGQDGTIYFSRSAGIYALNGNGTTNRIISLDGMSLGHPAIGPDGSIYVDASSGSFPTTTDYLYCLTPGGITNWQVALDGSILDTPIIGPDNNLYFCTRNPDGSSTLYVIKGMSGNAPSPWSSVRGDFRNSGQAAQMSTAQTFMTLHSFSNTDGDGAQPLSGLILSGNNLYGTTSGGGSSGNGAVFKVNNDGTGFTNLHSFAASGTNSSGLDTNSDGSYPSGSLVLSGNTLFGTALNGGSWGLGTVFAINTDGTGFTNLHTFTGGSGDGAIPYYALILSGNVLYGTAANGGSQNAGIVFKIATDGTGFTVLHNFTGGSDGGHPHSGVVSLGSTLFGSTTGGGNFGEGTVFAVNTDGTAFKNLHTFTAFSSGTNSDGAYPRAGLILSGNTLYGTALYGGSRGFGNVFALNTDGTGFTNIHNFSDGIDGGNPWAGLVLSSNTLYGATFEGGSSGEGTVFAVNTDGTSFTVLHSFTATAGRFAPNSDGAGPIGGLIILDNTLYGTASGGGSSGYGTVFSISLPAGPPQLTITPAGANVVLSWPTAATGFALQSTTNLGSQAWTTNLPPPVVVNGQFTVTNPISGKQQVFRLSQ